MLAIYIALVFAKGVITLVTRELIKVLVGDGNSMEHSILDTLINGSAWYARDHGLSPAWTLILVVGVLFLEISIVYLLLRIIHFLAINSRTFLSWVLRKLGAAKETDEYICLQLTFPARTQKSAYATEQLYLLLKSMSQSRGFLETLAAPKKTYSLELASNMKDGIRYIIRLPSSEIETVSQTLLSFMSGLKIKPVKDYLSALTGTSVGVIELNLGFDYVLPLKELKVLGEHDPIAYITGNMRKLGSKDVVALQAVVTPVYGNTHPGVSRRIRSIRHRIALNKEIASKLTARNISIGSVLLKAFVIPFKITTTLFTTFFEVLSAVNRNDIPDKWKAKADKRDSSDPYESDINSSVKQKLDLQLFEVSLRLLVASDNPKDLPRRLDALISSFEPFSTNQQKLIVSRPGMLSKGDKIIERFKDRTLTPHILNQPTILSSSELADIYHFPDTNNTKTEDLISSKSKELPVPLNQKASNTDFDVVMGTNTFDGSSQDIGMTLKQRQKHTYIIGKTGTGKTTMLINSIYQDMVNGKGLAVLDPHGDMFRELLRMVPKNRLKDVVVFDPSDREYPVGLNILDPGIEFTDEDDKHEWITSSVLSVFAKLADEHQWGPRMEHILRNTTLTALQTEKPSLYTLQRLLTDKKYQKEVAKNLDDPILKQFWDKEFKLMGTMQMSSATAPLTHRLGHFISSKMSRHILLQETSTLRIADIMNQEKILLVNLSKGDIGEDQSFFFGTILTSFIWMAAYQRTKIAEKDRKDFFIYVDEFQNFATPQFGDITSEGRKFHVSLIVSHQSVAQIKDKDLLKVIAGNAATMISLKVGSEDENFILPYMKPEVEKGDIVNLAPYSFYMKVSGDDSEDAFSGVTVPLSIKGNEETFNEVIETSRKTYGVRKSVVEVYLKGLLGQETGARKEAPAKNTTPAKNSKRTSTAKIHKI